MNLLRILLSTLLFFSAFNTVFAQQPSQSDIIIYQQDMKRIENYLNNIKTMVSMFTQVAQDGSVSGGTFYLSRPGKLRWEYDKPNPILIIAKGSLLTYYDKELDQVSHISLGATMAGFLTQEHISFTKGVEILSYDRNPGYISVELRQPEKEEDGSLTLIFRDDPMELKKMIVTDPAENRTTIVFESNVYDRPIDKKLFVLPRISTKKK